MLGNLFFTLSSSPGPLQSTYLSASPQNNSAVKGSLSDSDCNRPDANQDQPLQTFFLQSVLNLAFNFLSRFFPLPFSKLWNTSFLPPFAIPSFNNIQFLEHNDMDPLSVSLIASAIVGAAAFQLGRKERDISQTIKQLRYTSFSQTISNLLNLPITVSSPPKQPSIRLVDLSQRNDEKTVLYREANPVFKSKRTEVFYRAGGSKDVALAALSVVFSWLSSLPPPSSQSSKETETETVVEPPPHLTRSPERLPHPLREEVMMGSEVVEEREKEKKKEEMDPLSAHRTKVLQRRPPNRRRSSAILPPLPVSQTVTPLVPRTLTPPSPLRLRPSTAMDEREGDEEDVEKVDGAARRKRKSLYLSNVDTLTSFALPRSPSSPLSPPKRSVSDPLPSSSRQLLLQQQQQQQQRMPIHTRVRYSSTTFFSAARPPSAQPFSSRKVKSDVATPSPLFVLATASGRFDRCERMELDAKYVARKERDEEVMGERVEEVRRAKERTVWAREEWRRAGGRARGVGLWSC
ncbi:hypothetical protein BT69DRAFT_1276857 [Atractiella rhizophila]|nr:hypothetical protein BT69DRAFT_1276857 [Atractiella rhizophila]